MDTTLNVDSLAAIQLRTAELRPLADRLGVNIALRRKALGFTQARLAEMLNVDTETLSRFERGKHLPSLANLERLARLLHATVSDLLDEQPQHVDEDAVLISAWLLPLDGADRSFVKASIKASCDYLAGRSKPV